MAIKIKVEKQQEEPKDIKIKVGEQEEPPKIEASVKLNARRSLDGKRSVRSKTTRQHS